MERRLPRRTQLLMEGLRAFIGFDLDGGERAFQALLAEFPRENAARLYLAFAHWRHDRFDRGVEVLQEGLSVDPKDHWLWNHLAMRNAGSGNLDAALEAIDRGGALLPGDPMPAATRGDILFVAGRDEEAILAYQKSLELGPAAMGYYGHLALAFVYADQKQFSLAESTLREYGRLSKDPQILFFEAHLEEARGRLEVARDLCRKAAIEQAKTHRNDFGGQALLALAHISQVLGDSSWALAFARQQKLGGEEYQPISFLEAVQGDSAGAEQNLQKYAAACPWVRPAGVQIFHARNRMAAALQRNDGQAAKVSALRLPILPDTWMTFYEARSALLRRDFGLAENLLKRALILHRWFLMVFGVNHTRSPLVSLLCHFHLGQVYEATGKRGQAADEYREFLSAFEGSASRLPQIPEARAALKRLESHDPK
jgi:tetratricopeptide (TPR) repeat protein